MTQEELDALMSGGFDDIDTLEEDTLLVEEDLPEQDGESFDDEDDVIAKKVPDAPVGYSKDTAHHWPMPATDENKMVHQLDDVTRESEEKASEIFDIIDGVSNQLMEGEGSLGNVIETLESNIALFGTLHKKFPDVAAFGVQLEKNSAALEEANQILQGLQTSGESIMSVMDIMQYQDIHRQKIERVINVMRALSNYMNSLFEGRIEDKKRVSSAQHIVGDTHNELASNEDIEALLAQFSK
ncbi:MAG: chemotaxis protein [Sulfurimonas sp.]|nr:chemotaxis protein [Sulfurimonas sp.]